MLLLCMVIVIHTPVDGRFPQEKLASCLCQTQEHPQKICGTIRILVLADDFNLEEDHDNPRWWYGKCQKNRGSRLKRHRVDPCTGYVRATPRCLIGCRGVRSFSCSGSRGCGGNWFVVCQKSIASRWICSYQRSTGCCVGLSSYWIKLLRRENGIFDVK